MCEGGLEMFQINKCNLSLENMDSAKERVCVMNLS